MVDFKQHTEIIGLVEVQHKPTRSRLKRPGFFHTGISEVFRLRHSSAEFGRIIAGWKLIRIDPVYMKKFGSQ